jgi:hypothetical protein
VSHRGQFLMSPDKPAYLSRPPSRGGRGYYTLSKLLGHVDIKTTMAYTEATEGLRRSAVEKLPEIHIKGSPAARAGTSSDG